MGVTPARYQDEWFAARLLLLPYGRTRPSQYAGPTLCVGHCQHTDLAILHKEDERVWKAGKQRSPDLEVRIYVLKPRKGTRAASD